MSTCVKAERQAEGLRARHVVRAALCSLDLARDWPCNNFDSLRGVIGQAPVALCRRVQHILSGL